MNRIKICCAVTVFYLLFAIVLPSNGTVKIDHGFAGNVNIRSSQKFAVLKLDDVIAGSEGQIISERWQRVADYLERKKIKSSMGIIGYSLVENNPAYFRWITDRAVRGYIEFWNHGFHLRKQNADGTFEPQYTVDEFMRSYSEQLYSLKMTDSLAREKLKLNLRVWGPHWSNANLDTDRALAQIPQIQMTFGYPPEVKHFKGFVFRNRIDFEHPTHNPDFDTFLKTYVEKSKDWDYFYLQGHPGSWDETRWKNFIKVIEYLEKEGVKFVTPSELLDIVGTNAQTVRKIDSLRLKEIIYPPLTDREGKDLVLPVPPAEHPRLFFRRTHLSEINMKANHPLLKESWEKVNQSANYVTDGKLEQGVIMNYNLRIINAIEAKAFMYALTGDQIMGNEAVDLIFNLNNTLIINPEKGDVCREIGRVILATAVVYDWCYELISPAEKKELIAIMESLAADMEVKWPSLVQGSVTGHGVEAQLARDIISFAIAVYDEKPEIYKRAAGRIFAEFIPAQNFTYLSGYHHQGSAYGPSRFQWEIYTTLIFDRLGYPNIISKLQGKMPYRWVYTRRPDGQLFRDGDDWVERNPFGYYWNIFDLAYLASYYQDPLLMGEAIKQGNPGRNPLYDLLLIDPEVKPDYNLGSLPLTRYFPYPFGGMTARTSWNNGSRSDAVVADMKIVERQYNNHQHLDAGSFQIYYKGPLAIETGVYEGTQGAYGSDHFKNYYQRTIAHNCMLVYDPNEIFTWHNRPVANDGGQRLPGGGSEPRVIDIVMSEEYKKGEVRAYGFGPNPVKPEYSYLKGDITRAYTDKVKNHQRSFVFLNLDNDQVPAVLIVFDYIVSSDKNFKKTWLLHCVQEPVFNGNTFTVVRDEKGYSGKLVNNVLLPLPQNSSLEKVGGPGKEFYVGGVNYPNPLRNEDNSGDGALWRIELSPKIASETDVFLNVMQVADAGNSKLLPVEKIETDWMTGTKIGDRIVMFAKNGIPGNLPISLNIKGSGVFKVLMADLENGNWEITGPNSPGFVRNNQNHLYFHATEGNYFITKK